MCRGLGVSCRHIGLVLTLACLGCHSLHEPQPTPPGLMDLTPPPAGATDAQPARALLIPGPPAAAATPRAGNPVESPPVLASAPAAPSAAVTQAPPPTQVASLVMPGAQPTAPPALQADRLPAPPSAAASASPLRRLAQQATAVYASFDSYSARLRQREQVNGKDRPEELMLLRFRKQPWSVYFKWVGPEAQGREVVYVAGRPDGKIHTRLAAGDVPLFPAGARFDVAPDSSLARGRSRHPITEAGIGTLVERFARLVDASDRGDARAGSLTYLGTQTRPEFAAPVEVVEQVIAPGAETTLPHGGRRDWFFATDSHLPLLATARDQTGHEVEYYCYDQVQPGRFTDADFDPDRLWAKR